MSWRTFIGNENENDKTNFGEIHGQSFVGWHKILQAKTKSAPLNWLSDWGKYKVDEAIEEYRNGKGDAE